MKTKIVLLKILKFLILREEEELKKRLLDLINVQLMDVKNVMGNLIRSENSLN